MSLITKDKAIIRLQTDLNVSTSVTYANNEIIGGLAKFKSTELNDNRFLYVQQISIITNQTTDKNGFSIYLFDEKPDSVFADNTGFDPGFSPDGKRIVRSIGLTNPVEFTSSVHYDVGALAIPIALKSDAIYFVLTSNTTNGPWVSAQSVTVAIEAIQ